MIFDQQEEFKGVGTVATSGNYVAFSGTNQITGATSGATGTTAGTTETVTLLNSNTVTLTSGYSVPATTPSPSDGNASYFTIGSNLYQFLARVAPTVTLSEAWATVDVPSGPQYPNP